METEFSPYPHAHRCPTCGIKWFHTIDGCVRGNYSACTGCLLERAETLEDEYQRIVLDGL